MLLFQYIINNRASILFRLAEHIQLTGMSVIAAILIGVPLGILISYIRPLNKPVIGTANIFQSIPSIALLGFLIPVLGIGEKPAVFMTVVYCLLPIIKNTSAGLSNINAEMLETAKGIGMNPLQILFRIKMPLALPIIMAGIRISAVMSVGLITIAAFVGAGGLGFVIYSGMRTSNNNMLLSGAIAASLLTLLVDFAVAAVERFVTPEFLRKKK